jgi:hypothetical protein
MIYNYISLFPDLFLFLKKVNCRLLLNSEAQGHQNRKASVIEELKKKG